jgi:hypothetical protein
MSRNPDIPEQRPYLYALLAWCHAGVWLIAVVATVRYQDAWPLWAKVAAWLGLIVTTPDLLALRPGHHSRDV